MRKYSYSARPRHTSHSTAKGKKIWLLCHKTVLRARRPLTAQPQPRLHPPTPPLTPPPKKSHYTQMLRRRQDGPRRLPTKSYNLFCRHTVNPAEQPPPWRAVGKGKDMSSLSRVLRVRGSGNRNRRTSAAPISPATHNNTATMTTQHKNYSSCIFQLPEKCFFFL